MEIFTKAVGLMTSHQGMDNSPRSMEVSIRGNSKKDSSMVKAFSNGLMDQFTKETGGRAR
jgi:hypothetical protein